MTDPVKRPHSRPMVKLNRSEALRLEPDPRAPTWASWVDWARSQTRPLAIDLFCGGGGLSLGLEDAGFRVGLAVDHDSWSIETHAANIPGLAVQMDLSVENNVRRLIRLLKQVDVALIAGGPPCQPFSRAGRSAIRFLIAEGRRQEVDPRKTLWRVWMRIVLAVRPRAVMLENVPDLALGDDLRVVRRMTDALEKAGFETYLDVVEAPELGVPQHRQRFILVALRDAEPFHWPSPGRSVNIWEAIGDLPRLGEGIGASVLPYRKPTTPFQQCARSGVAPEDEHLVYDHMARAVRDDDREAFRLMTSTSRYSDLPEHLRRYRADTFDDKYKRHGKHELARSITAHIAKDGYWYIHPVEERTFTVREAARLQTFPDWYRFAGNRTHAFQQIGNAVPPLLAERIGRQIMVSLGQIGVQEQLCTLPGHSPVGHISRDRLRQARQHLDEWSAKNAVVAPWRHPSDPWTALVGTVLIGRRIDDGAIALVLWQIPTPGAYSAERLDEMDVSSAMLSSLRRLQPAVAAWKAAKAGRISDRLSRWWEETKLQPAEAARFRLMGLGDDVLLTTQPPLRVAARVTGRPVDKVDRLTDGRLALAMLVGGGSEAAARMAGVAAVGQSLCTIKDPQCGSCPFLEICHWADQDAFGHKR